MLDHLISAKAADYVPEVEDSAGSFEPLNKADATETLKAQIGTSEWLQEIAEQDEEILNQAQMLFVPQM